MTQIDQEEVEIKAEAKSTKNIKKMELFIDGSSKTEVEDDSLQETVKLDKGIHKIKVKATNEDGKTGESEITVGINKV